MPLNHQPPRPWRLAGTQADTDILPRWFLDGDGPGHLPGHTIVGLSLGKSFGENWSLAVNTLNIGDHRYMLDNSNTFGGTHYAYPREIYVEMRYRFHF